MPSNLPTIHVLAGVNGAGKSTIGQHIFQAEGTNVFNPDTLAARIQQLHSGITLTMANGHAWQIGRELLEKAIRERRDYRFETTLGGNTIVTLLEQAARKGMRLHVWFAGLESPELHIQRVKRRVAHGGHDIPEEKIRERWTRSRENLVRLMPLIAHLRVYDNSVEGDPAEGKRPSPRLVLEWQHGKITGPEDIRKTPSWAEPLVGAAYRLQRQGTY